MEPPAARLLCHLRASRLSLCPVPTQLLCPEAMTEPKCGGYENLGIKSLWDNVSVTQGPSSKTGQPNLQEETQIQDPQLRVTQPSWPGSNSHYCPQICPSLRSSPRGPSNQRLERHPHPNYLVLSITLSGVLPPEHFGGPFQGNWRILSLSCFMDPSKAPRALDGVQDGSIIGQAFKAS